MPMCARIILGDAIHVGVRNLHGSAHVLIMAALPPGAEGDDRRRSTPVFLCDVNCLTSRDVHAEVNVNRAVETRSGSEALKQQLMLQRIGAR